jgi:hypothetical protein
MNINEWKQTGKIYVWRYRDNPKNYRGWHMTANKSGCKSALNLLQTFTHSSIEFWRTIQLSVPTSDQYGVPNCSSKPIAESKLVINKNEKPDFWKLENKDDKLFLEMGINYIHKLMSGVTDIQNNKGDYFIGSKGQELWFWW